MTRVVAVTMVPVWAMGLLAWTRITEQQTRADAAADMVISIELQQALTAIYPPAQLERIALEGLARIDELGLDRDTVIELSGVDLESLYSENAARLDAALAETCRVLERLGDDESIRLKGELEAVHQEIEAQRLDLSTPTTPISDPARPFDRLDSVVADVWYLSNTLVDIDAHVAEVEASRLAALADVMASAGSYGDAVLRNLVSPGDTTPVEVSERGAVHAAMLDRLISISDGERRAGVEVVRDQFMGLGTVQDLGLGPSPEVNAGDASTVQDAAALLLGHIDYMEALAQQAQVFAADVVATVSSLSEQAHDEVMRTQLLVGAIIAVTAVLAAALLWSTMVPLRRLTRQAELISEGSLDLEPVPASGARETRALAATLNELLATMRSVESQIGDLADGAVTPRRRAVLPGAIGEALRRSVDRLADTTHKLHASEQLASAIVEQAADAIWTIDETGTICSANDASVELTGVAIADQIGKVLDDFLPGLDGEMNVIGAPTPTKVLVAHSVIDAGATMRIAVIARDISERAHFEDRLAYQARHDALTSMPNRLAVLEHLDHVFTESDEPVAVLFVDIDGFKSVNDTHGHLKGDWVLTEIASRLSSSVRADEFVARLGGDEFVVVISGIGDIDTVVKFGERLIRQVEQPYFDGENFFALSASVGVAAVAGERSSLEALRKADSACYSAKRHGRGRVEVYDAELQATIAREADLALALRRSVPNNELVLHLQPIVDLHTGCLTGAEALVRWNRPGVGLVPPGDFIPIAERSSLIFDIERWVLRTACEHVVAWRERDPHCDLRVAVNISGRHLIEGDLVGDLHDAIERTGADPTMLEFELTETQLLDDLDRATDVLVALRSLGVTIAVDDFGTGYSSMTYLRHLPIDSIKIDQSFIARATEKGFDSTVVESLLAIGRTLHLGVVAEGVETESQLDYVRNRGCDRAQGYLLARPMPAEAFDAQLAAGDWPVPHRVDAAAR